MKTHILVIDDNPTNLKLAMELLKYAGYDTRGAADAETALEAIRAEMPGLILLDIQLPVMDGLTLARILKADPKTKNIRLVALSAFAMESDKQRAFEAGCEGYITKPIEAAKFIAQVSEFLQR